MILLAHPTGNQNVREAALALEHAGLLSEFWTSFAWKESWVADAILPRSLLRDLRRRSFPQEISHLIKTSPWADGARLICNRLPVPRSFREHFSVDAIYRDLDQRVATRLLSREFKGVYAYEDGAGKSFQIAQRSGISTIYDLPIGYWRAGQAIYLEEADRLPGWSATLPGLTDSFNKLERKDEELQSADAVLVASRFTAETLKQAPFPVCEPMIIPYGCNAPRELLSTNKEEPTRKGNPLRVLFVGSLSQRKGIYELFHSVEALGERVSLTLVGARVGECKARDVHLRRHCWHPTLAHDEVLRLMGRHDVLVFPSLFEGFGLVITEALSQGLPVITTDHTCGPDILSEGVDGFLVPVRDWQAIAARLEQLDHDRSLLALMKANALATAAKNPWGRYRSGIANAVREILTGSAVARRAADAAT